MDKSASPAEERSVKPVPSVPETIDDMDDSRDMPAGQPLRAILEHCQQIIYPEFSKADREALLKQRSYRGRAVRTAYLGSTAVILAIVQLTFPSEPKTLWGSPMFYLSVCEMLTAGLAVLIILLGIGTYLKEQWLVARYRAERLRLLKFKFLLEPAMWSADNAAIELCRGDLRDQVREINNSRFPALENWIAEGTVPYVLKAPAPGLSAEALEELVAYYRRKRLNFQADYLAGATTRAFKKDSRTRLVPPVLFFGSIAFVLAHFGVEVSHGLEAWSRLLILMAAALPALGAGFRIYRSANEFARNASRFEANHNALRVLSERLRHAKDDMSAFREMGFCEQVLEADHREWQRIMVEAEWFG